MSYPGEDSGNAHPDCPIVNREWGYTLGVPSVPLAFGRAAALAALFSVADLTGCAFRRLPPAPGHFLWGVSTSGYQVEGGDTNSQWAAWVAGGMTEHRNPQATDSYRRWREDLDLAAGMGLSAYRFGIEWSRIAPTAGTIDKKAIAHYVTIAKEARARGMTPIVTLYHFTYPKWFDQADPKGRRGWERPDSPKIFGKYVAAIAGAFAKEKPLWLTINEPTIYTGYSYFLGLWPPAKRDVGAALTVLGNLLDAHGEAYREIHARLPDARVSFNNMAPTMHVGRVFEAFALGAVSRKAPLDDYSFQPDLAFLALLHPKLKKEVDFAALDYYFPTALTAVKTFQPWDWPVYPTGLYEAVKAYAEFFRKPVLVAENGMATQDGGARADGWTREAYLAAHVREVMRARADGIPVMGYCHWSLLDNFEWGTFTPRFGLYEVNFGDEALTRVPTPAVAYFKSIAAHDGVSPELSRLIDAARTLR